MIIERYMWNVSLFEREHLSDELKRFYDLENLIANRRWWAIIKGIAPYTAQQIYELYKELPHKFTLDEIKFVMQEMNK